MKTPLSPRFALLAGALSVAGMSAILADDSTTTASTTPPPHMHHGMLTPEERTELKTDRDAVFAANPDLKTEETTLHDQMKAHMDKMTAAILKQDPAAAPILAKMDHHHGPPDASEGSAPSQ